MQAHYHLLGVRSTSLVDLVESVANEAMKTIRPAATAAKGARVVHIVAIRYHEPASAFDVDEIGQVVIDGVTAVVNKAPFFDDELARVQARAVARHPSERPLPRGALHRIDRLADREAFLV